MKETTKKRILDAATSLFLLNGYERVSVASIAKKARASKETIYRHYKSKEGLFIAVIDGSCDGVDAPKLGSKEDDKNLEQALYRAGCALLFRIYEPKVLRVMRLAIGSFHAQPDLAKMFWQHGPQYGLAYVRDSLVYHAKDQRSKKQIDEQAKTFYSRIAGNHLFFVLLGLEEPPNSETIKQHLRADIDWFLDHFTLEKHEIRK